MLKTAMLCHSHEHHDQCISQALESAEEVCAQRGVRLTPLRKRVLELVWQSHKPLGAYDMSWRNIRQLIRRLLAKQS